MSKIDAAFYTAVGAMFCSVLTIGYGVPILASLFIFGLTLIAAIRPIEASDVQ